MNVIPLDRARSRLRPHRRIEPPSALGGPAAPASRAPAADEAEDRLRANDIPGMMTILNTLRASPQALSSSFNSPVMAALPTPPDQATAMEVFFREKAGSATIEARSAPPNMKVAGPRPIRAPVTAAVRGRWAAEAAGDADDHFIT